MYSYWLHPDQAPLFLAQTIQRAFDITYVSNLDELGLSLLSSFLQRKFNKFSYNKLTSFRDVHPIFWDLMKEIGSLIRIKLRFAFISQSYFFQEWIPNPNQNANLSASYQLWALPKLFPDAKYIINLRDFDDTLKSQKRIFNSSGTFFPVHYNQLESNISEESLEKILNIYLTIFDFSLLK